MGRIWHKKGFGWFRIGLVFAFFLGQHVQIHSSLVEWKGVPTISILLYTVGNLALFWHTRLGRSCAAKPSASWTGGLVARPPSQPAPAVSFIYIIGIQCINETGRERRVQIGGHVVVEASVQGIRWSKRVCVNLSYMHLYIDIPLYKIKATCKGWRGLLVPCNCNES